MKTLSSIRRLTLAFGSLAFALTTFTLSMPAAAVPIHATFSGTITGGEAFSNNVLSQFPLGTSASFDVSFDDAGFGPSAPLTDYDLAPVSGTVRLGALEWLLDAGSITSYSYSFAPGFPIVNYGLQLTGSGPSINSNGSLFGLFLRITPSLDPVSIAPFLVGFRFPFAGGGGESYGYAVVNGTSTITRGTVSVPEPNTLLLTLAAFAVFWLSRRNRRVFARMLGH